MQKKMTIKATVSGKVQGVFFRAGTQEQAESLQLTGWIKNLPNSDVELVVSGDRDHIMQITDWLWQGPPAAEVSNVHWEEIPYEQFSEFKVI